MVVEFEDMTSFISGTDSSENTKIGDTTSIKKITSISNKIYLCYSVSHSQYIYTLFK